MARLHVVKGKDNEKTNTVQGNAPAGMGAAPRRRTVSGASDIPLVPEPTVKKQPSDKTTSADASSTKIDDEPEYEYVSFSELVRPYVERLMFWMKELNTFFVCLLILLACVLVIIIGNMTSAIFIVGALLVLAVLFAIVLYSLWQNKKAADRELKRAEMLYEESQKIITDHIEEPSDGDANVAKNKK